jgi:poly(3-hydroxybutyrate) depolymerase
MMALKAECDRPDVFAGAVSVSGTLEQPCAGRRPVSAMMIHGQRDTTIPYYGQRHSKFLGVPLPAAPTAAARLAARSSCTANRKTSGKYVRRMQYVGCAERTSVLLVTVPALGHRWPDTQHDHVDGGALTWTFLRAQKRLG